MIAVYMDIITSLIIITMVVRGRFRSSLILLAILAGIPDRLIVQDLTPLV